MVCPDGDFTRLYAFELSFSQTLMHPQGVIRYLWTRQHGQRCLHVGIRKWKTMIPTPEPSRHHFPQESRELFYPVTFSLDLHRCSLPAMSKWFLTEFGHDGALETTLNIDYLLPFGATLLPIELTSDSTAAFQRSEAPLSIFLDYCRLQSNTSEPLFSRFYLAQAPISRLPRPLLEDLPIPELLSEAGPEHIYDSNIWMGLPPTYTPLHRDPNHNLLVQLAGEKVVRLLSYQQGHALFSMVAKHLGGPRSEAIRGNEMMIGEERNLLDKAIWDAYDADKPMDPGPEDGPGLEVTLKKGDALLIPQGWWHSVKGTGSGITASANWWFRS